MTVGQIQDIDGHLLETRLDSAGNEVALRIKDRHRYTYHGTGTAADDAEFAKIVAAVNAGGSGEIVIAGDVMITTLHTITVPVTLTGLRGARVISGAAAAHIYINRYQDPWDAPALTELAINATTAGQSFISGTAALGIAQGDYVAIYSDDEIPNVPRNDNAREIRSLEVHRVVKPSRPGGIYSTTDFEIDGFLWDALTTSPRIAVLPMVKDVLVRNLTFVSAGTELINSTIGFGNCANVRIINCTFGSPAAGEVALAYVHDACVHGCSFLEKYEPDDTSQLSGEGYGVTISNCTTIDIADNKFGFMRHGVTTGSPVHTNGHDYGMTRGLVVRNNNCFAGNATLDTGSPTGLLVMDSHAAGCEIVYDGNVFNLQKAASASGCIWARSRNVIIKNNQFLAGAGTNAGLPVTLYGPGATIDGNYFENCWHGVKTADNGKTNANTDDVTVRRNTFKNMSGSGVSLEFGDNAVIENNTIENASTAAIRIRSTAGTGHRIRNNLLPSSNTLSVFLDTGATKAQIAEFSGNTCIGYPGNLLGFDRSTNDGRDLDALWSEANVRRPGIVKKVTGHSLTEADDLYAPVTRAGAVVDDTDDTEYEGVLQSVSGDDLTFYPVGAQFAMTDGRLPGSGSYTPGTSDRLWWDQGNTDQDGNPGAYVLTEPGDNVIGPVLRIVDQIGTNPGGVFVVQVLGPTVGAAGSGGGETSIASVADMVALMDLVNGHTYDTQGYYAVGDGGSNSYVYHATGRSGETMDSGFYITGGGADDYFEAIDKTVANVLKFGAKGGGDQADIDDTEFFQNAITAIRKQGNADGGGYRSAKMIIPGGFYRIKKTLDWANTRSYTIEGTGPIGGQGLVHPNAGFPHGGSCLIWDRQEVSVAFDSGTDFFTAVGHGFEDGDIVTMRGTFPTGFDTKQDEWYICNKTADTFQLQQHVIGQDIGTAPVLGSDNGSSLTVEYAGIMRMGSSFHVSDLSFWGDLPQADGSNRGSVGMLIPTRPGIATGNCLLENVAFTQFDRCLQMGVYSHDHNCENMVATYVSFGSSGVGYEVKNNQAVGHQFNFVNLYYADTGFRFRSGGKFHVDYVSTIKTDRILEFNSNGGGWVGPFDIDVLLVDGAMAQTPQIVYSPDINASAGLSVHVESMSWPNSNGCRPDGRPLVSVDGSWNVEIDRMERWPLDRSHENSGVTYNADGTWTGWAGTVDGTDMDYAVGSIMRLSSTTTLPSAFAADTDYFIVEVNDTGTAATSTFKLSATREGSAITGGDTGTGTHSAHTSCKLAYLGATATTYRPRVEFDFIKYNLANPSDLTDVDGYWENHLHQNIVMTDERYCWWEVRKGVGAANNVLWRHRKNHRFLYEHGREQVVNVLDHGAKGDQSTDDTAAIQRAVDEWKYLNGDYLGGVTAAQANMQSKLYFPAGFYRITSTIDFDNVGRSVIYGDGRNSVQNYNWNAGAVPQGATILIWDGGAGAGEMIDMTGGNDELMIRDMSFWGAPLQQTTDYGDIGIKIEGYAYNNHFDNVAFARWGAAIQNGTSAGSSWADALVVGNVIFRDCEAGYLQKTTNANGHRFEHISAYECIDVIRMEGGGHLDIGVVDFQNIDNLLYCPVGFGGATGGARIGQARVDNSQDRTPTIVNTESEYWTVVVDQVTFQSQTNATWKYDGHPMFKMHGGGGKSIVVNQLDWFNGGTTGQSVCTNSGDTWDQAAHGLEVGMVLTLSTSDTLPTGFSPGTYYVTEVVDSGSFKLSASPGGTAITGSDGSGTHYLERFACLLSCYSTVSSYESRFVLQDWANMGELSYWQDEDFGGRIKIAPGTLWQVNRATAATTRKELSPIGNVVGITKQYEGTPEGNVPGPVGQTCVDRTNGALYVKNSGTSTTGWQPTSATSSAVADSDTTPAAASRVLTVAAGALTWAISDFVGTLADGQELKVLIDNSGAGVVTITHGSGINLDGAVDFVPTNKGALTLVYDGADWIEAGRSDY